MCDECVRRFRSLMDCSGPTRAEWTCATCGPQEYDSADDDGGGGCMGLLFAVAAAIVLIAFAVSSFGR